MCRQRLEPAAEREVEARPDQYREGRDEEVGRHGEDSSRLADATQIGEGDEGDKPHAERHAVGQQHREGGRQRGHAGGDADRHCEHVVDQQRRGRHQP